MRIVETVLLTGCLNELKRFYTVTLGLPLADESAGRFTVGAGRSALTFQQAASAQPPVYHFAFNIPENRIEDARRWLADRVAPLARDGMEIIHFESWNAHAVYFLDPAGHIVELIARHNLSNASDEPFGPSSFLEISEVGLPCADVTRVTNDLREAFGLNLWKGDGQAFNAVGDEQGLLILVNTGRLWFMTQMPATVFPVNLTIAGPELRHLQLESGAYHIYQVLSVF